MRCRTLVSASLLILSVFSFTGPSRAQSPVASADLVGAVTDSSSGDPLPSCLVAVSRGSAVVDRTGTDAFGRFTIHNLPTGSYSAEIRALGFRTARSDALIGSSGHETSLVVALAPAPITVSGVE